MGTPSTEPLALVIPLRIFPDDWPTSHGPRAILEVAAMEQKRRSRLTRVKSRQPRTAIGEHADSGRHPNDVNDDCHVCGVLWRRATQCLAEQPSRLLRSLKKLVDISLKRSKRIDIKIEHVSGLVVGHLYIRTLVCIDIHVAEHVLGGKEGGS